MQASFCCFVARHDEAVLAVPEVTEATIGCHVSVGVVGELFRRFSNEDCAGGGGRNGTGSWYFS